MPLEMEDALDQIQGAHFTEEETEAQKALICSRTHNTAEYQSWGPNPYRLLKNLLF